MEEMRFMYATVSTRIYELVRRRLKGYNKVWYEPEDETFRVLIKNGEFEFNWIIQDAWDIIQGSKSVGNELEKMYREYRKAILHMYFK